MPDESPALLDWNEDNLSNVLSELYQEVASNEDLRRELMANPFEVLRRRVNVPESYRGGIFVREKNQRAMVLHIPVSEGSASRESLPEGTVADSPDYEIVCTTITEW